MKLKPIYLDEDTQISTKPCHIIGIVVDAVDDTATIIVYNESTSGKTATKKVIPIHITTAQLTKAIAFPDPGLWCNEGCYVAVTWDGVNEGDIVMLVDL